MANRYWVGGSGTWNTTSTTNWSASSGGASGASVPTAADSVFFDQAATYTVTMTGALTCLDISVPAGVVTFATGTAPTLAISGSISLLLSTTLWNTTAPITFNATTTGKTIGTNNVNMTTSSVTLNGVGGGWTLTSAFRCGAFTLTNGAFSTGNFAWTNSGISSTGSTVRSISLGSSAVTISSGTVDFSNNTNLTFNAGTSTITSSATSISGANSSGGLSGVAFYNVILATGFTSISGINSYNNLTINQLVTTCSFTDTQTIAGVFTVPSGTTRLVIQSATAGLQCNLVLNGTFNLSDVLFRDIYFAGSAGVVSGTRIGNLGGCSNITFTPSRTVYWVTLAGGNWSSNSWSDTVGGAANTIYLPLPQDVATFSNTGLNASATVVLDYTHVSSINMQGRTTAMTIGGSINTVFYGDITNGSGTTWSGTGTITFSGRNIQTITSAGKSFTMPMTIDSYGGTVQLADAFTNTDVNTGLVLTNGTFDTKGFAVTLSCNLTSNNTNVRAMYLRASTVTVGGSSSTPVTFNPANFTFDAGTSTITSSRSFNATYAFGGLTYNNVILSQGNTITTTITGANTFNNLTLRPVLSANAYFLSTFTFNATNTITGTFTAASSSSYIENRVFIKSATANTRVSIVAAASSFFAVNFQDIALSGGAAGTGTSIGNSGNNTGITFSTPKTVYWNLTGSVNWCRGWATTSGGAPSNSNAPLPQDTIVFNEAGAATTINLTSDVYIGTFNAAARNATGFTISSGVYSIYLYGNLLPSSFITNSANVIFTGSANQTITSAGANLSANNVYISKPSGTVQLADAFSTGGGFLFNPGNLGTFDAVSYNVTASSFTFSTAGTVKMGSGTWTTTSSSNATLWNSGGTSLVVECGTSTLTFTYQLASQSITMVTGGQSFNKIILGGSATQTSNTFIFNDSSAIAITTIAELSSTKTRAYTIQFFATRIYGIGKWSITGTLGNVVTVRSSTAASAFTLNIMGPATSGIDYLSVRDCTVDTASPGEFYVGANSTNVSNNTRVIFTAPPAPRTLYWVGGTGNWSATTSWSTSSGGASGAAIPTSLDAVNFDSASNATAYTATIDAGVTVARCASLTVAGPASGNVTIAGTVAIASQGNISFAATGITRTWTGALYLSGNTSGLTINSNGFFSGNNSIYLQGFGSSWSMSSALTAGIFQIESGATFTTNNFALTTTQFNFPTAGHSRGTIKTFNAGSSAISIGVSGTAFDPGIATVFNAGTSTITLTNGTTVSAFFASSITLYNLIFSNALSSVSMTISGAYTFNNLTITAPSSTGVTNVNFSNAITVAGTLTLNGATEIRRLFAKGPAPTAVTLTVGTLSASNADFSDITIAGAAAGTSVTGGGNGGNNTGIVFPAPKTVYWNLTGAQTWTATGWAATSGGVPAVSNFPLLQDTAVFDNAGAATSVSTSTAIPNISNINATGRTSAMTLNLTTSGTVINFYGDLLLGSGVTLGATTSAPNFVERGTQLITTSGKPFPTGLTVNSLTGTVQLNDSLISSGALTLTSGTFNAVAYNVTTATFSSNNSNTRTLNMGSGTWTLTSTGLIWDVTTSTGMTLNKQTSSMSCSDTTTTARSFAGGGLSYPSFNIGGATGISIFTFTDSGNSFDNLTSTKTVAHTVSFGTTYQRFANWTLSGTSGNPATVKGSSSGSPALIIYTGASTISVDWLLPQFIRAYNYSNTWYVGSNSVNTLTQGMIFSAAPVNYGRFFLMFG